MDIPYSVLSAYGLKRELLQIETVNSGLINNTWKITDRDKAYILQRVNTMVFKEPGDIASNIQLITTYLTKHWPEYKFIAPLNSAKGEQLVHNREELPGYFRLFPFVYGSHSKFVVETPEQAYEAAVQFGRFTKLLSCFDVSKLKITLPFFHDLSYRYRRFQEALQNGNPERIRESEALINMAKQHAVIVSEFERIKSDPSFKKRVTHHDTKISNVLFNDVGKGLCVIDLDTVMPGYFISDVGDMMRTYLSPVSEEEKNIDKIEVRADFYKAIVKGYFEEMKDELTGKEKAFFFYSGKYMIYMQALRFLTDHISNDVYYGAKYPGHNFVRANNQIVLLQRLMEKEAMLTDLEFGNQF